MSIGAIRSQALLESFTTDTNCVMNRGRKSCTELSSGSIRPDRSVRGTHVTMYSDLSGALLTLFQIVSKSLPLLTTFVSLSQSSTSLVSNS